MSTRGVLRAFAAAAVAAALGGVGRGGAARAQSFALDADQSSILWMEIQRPSFQSDRHLSAWLGVVGVRCQVADQLSVLAGLPFARAERAAHAVDTVRVPAAAATELGNPYLGLRFGQPWRSVAVDAVVSVRLGKGRFPYSWWYYSYPYSPYYPSAPLNLVGMAAAAGDYDRYELYERGFPWTGRATALVSRQIARFVSVHVRGGGLIVGEHGAGPTFYGDLGAAGTYERGPALVNAGLTMRTGTSAWGSGATWQLGLGLGYRTGRTTPLVFVRLPLSGTSAQLPQARYVVGAGVTMRLSAPDASR